MWNRKQNMIQNAEFGKEAEYGIERRIWYIKQNMVQNAEYGIEHRI